MTSQQIVWFVGMEDEPVHTADRPECEDIACLCHHGLQVGDRVRIPDSPYRDEISYGTIYRFMPGRPHPWHVMPDKWALKSGVSYSAGELERITINGPLNDSAEDEEDL